jgi:hypothetical protein
VFAIVEYINYYHIQLTNYKKGRGKSLPLLRKLVRIQNEKCVLECNGIYYLTFYPLCGATL